MLLHHLLNALMQIAARVHQILVRLLHLILIELQLRLREVQLILERALLRSRRLRERAGELGDIRLVGLEQALRLLQADLDLLRLVAQNRRVRLDLPQCGGERDVEFVVGKLHRRFRNGSLVIRSGQQRQALGVQQRRLVYSGDGVGRWRGLSMPGASPGGLIGGPKAVPGEGQQD